MIGFQAFANYVISICSKVPREQSQPDENETGMNVD